MIMPELIRTAFGLPVTIAEVGGILGFVPENSTSHGLVNSP